MIKLYIAIFLYLLLSVAHGDKVNEFNVASLEKEVLASEAADIFGVEKDHLYLAQFSQNSQHIIGREEEKVPRVNLLIGNAFDTSENEISTLMLKNIEKYREEGVPFVSSNSFYTLKSEGKSSLVIDFQFNEKDGWGTFKGSGSFFYDSYAGGKEFYLLTQDIDRAYAFLKQSPKKTKEWYKKGFKLKFPKVAERGYPLLLEVDSQAWVHTYSFSNGGGSNILGVVSKLYFEKYGVTLEIVFFDSENNESVNEDKAFTFSIQVAKMIIDQYKKKGIFPSDNKVNRVKNDRRNYIGTDEVPEYVSEGVKLFKDEAPINLQKKYNLTSDSSISRFEKSKNNSTSENEIELKKEQDYSKWLFILIGGIVILGLFLYLIIGRRKAKSC
jgi:hypothetical protein